MQKKSFFKKKPFAPKKKVSKAVKKYVNKTIDQKNETKVFNSANTILSGTTLDNNGVISLLSNIAQGVTLNTRIGMVASPMSMSFRYQGIAYSASANNVNPTFIRIILLQTRQSAATAVVPTAAQVLESVGSALATVSAYDDVTTSTGQYKILYDRLHRADNGVGQQYSGKVVLSKKHLNKIHWVGGNGTDVSHGHLYLLAISDVAAATAPSLIYTWQIKYDDS